jgi:uncharacterized protein (TIGR03437 family)
MVAASSSQVDFVVPMGTEPGPATISARAGAAEVLRGQATITAASPGVFVLQPGDPSQPGAVLNQDSSVNSQANPAERGSMVQIFATGIATPVQVMIGETPATVVSSTPAPQLACLWQINARIPEDAAGQSVLFLIAGNSVSNGVTIWLR